MHKGTDIILTIRARVSPAAVPLPAIIGEPGSVIDGCNTFDPQGEEGYRGAHGITFENVTATGLKFPLCAYGDAAVPLSLALRNCRLSFAKGQNEIVRGANLKIDLSDVEVEGVDGGILRNYGPAVEIRATGLKGVNPFACKAEEPFAVEAI